MDTLRWLLDSDPAIRWQTLHDLTDASPAEIALKQARVPQQGIGAEILGAQLADGRWRSDDESAWRPTLFTLLLLRSTGIDPDDPAVRSAAARCQSNLRWDDAPGWWDVRPAASGGNAFFDGEVEPCINGGVLALSGYFGHPSARLAGLLLSEQLEDGGWNCEAPKSAVSSYHSTLCVLEGLLEYERATGGSAEIATARQRGEEYLLQRALFRRLSTGEVANPDFLQLAFPPSYHYDVLRALDYFRAAHQAPDPRLTAAIRYLESRRQPDDRWLLDRSYNESAVSLPEEAEGTPSRWNTLRVLRVLRWYYQSPPTPFKNL